MRLLLCSLLGLSVAVLPVAAQYRWRPGLDVVIPIYAEMTKGGVPGPLVNVLGYDADTEAISVLFIRDACYVTWTARPDQGHGLIRHVIQVAPRVFALLHDSGYIRLETQPDFAWCWPVAGDSEAQPSPAGW